MPETAGPPLPPALIQATRASEHAEVEIASLDGSEVESVERIIAAVWGPQLTVPSSLLRGLAHAGNVLLVAHSRSGDPLGFCLGYLGWADGFHLHSHMTAVVPGQQSAGVGYALKLWQRFVCIKNSIDEIRWTYDPMIARNAYFNLVKLGAQVRAFLPDFYAGMNDRINAGDHADRFEVSWRLTSPRVEAALQGGQTRSQAMDVAIPDDFEAMRAADLQGAIRARMQFRELIAERMASGSMPDWGRGGYVFRSEGITA